MSEPVNYVLQGGITRITMDDGKLNVMSLGMLEALHDAFDRAERDSAVVILGSARSGIFSAGFDLKVFAANDTEKSLAMVRVMDAGETLQIDPQGIPVEFQRRLLLVAFARFEAVEPRGIELSRALEALGNGRTVTLAGLKLEGGATWRVTEAPPRRANFARSGAEPDSTPG